MRSLLEETSVARDLSKAPEWMKANRDIMMAVVKRNGCALKYASNEVKADRDIVMAAVKQDGYWALRHASVELKSDRDFVLEAVKQDGRALGCASDEIKADRDIVMEAVKQDGSALRFASVELKADRGIVREAVKRDGSALGYASVELNADRDIVMEAVKQDGRALQHASAELKADRDIVIAQEENEEDSKKPSKRARTDKESDRPKSSLATISELSTKMVKIKKEARDSIRIAEKKKNEAEFALGECPICLEIQKEAVALTPCGHVMCSECANQNAANKCPICQTGVASHLRLHK